MGEARLAGEDDGVVRSRVGEAAVVDELHTEEVLEGHRRTSLWIQRLSARGRSSTHKDGEGKPEDANADKPVSSHGVVLPSWRREHAS